MKPKKENKKGGAIVSLIVGIIFVLLAIMCFIGDMDYLLGGKAKDLNEIAANVRPQKDDHVRTDSYLVLGNFAETKHYINGIIPAGKEQHYAIVLGDDNMDDITDAKIIVLTVKNKKTIKKLDELANDDNAKLQRCNCNRRTDSYTGSGNRRLLQRCTGVIRHCRLLRLLYGCSRCYADKIFWLDDRAWRSGNRRALYNCIRKD